MKTFEHDVLAVEPLDERQETPDTPGGKSPVEVKLKTTLKKPLKSLQKL